MSVDLKLLATRISNWWKSNALLLYYILDLLKVTIKILILSCDTFDINSE